MGNCETIATNQNVFEIQPTEGEFDNTHLEIP